MVSQPGFVYLKRLGVVGITGLLKIDLMHLFSIQQASYPLTTKRLLRRLIRTQTCHGTHHISGCCTVNPELERLGAYSLSRVLSQYLISTEEVTYLNRKTVNCPLT